MSLLVHNPKLSTVSSPGPFRTLKPLILASNSPRRQSLLSGLGLDFSVLPSSQNEPGPYDEEEPRDYALRMSRFKAEAIWSEHKDSWVLGADTVVVLDGEIIGKPTGKRQAVEMLTRLSGRVHEVWTACWLIPPKDEGNACSFIEGSKVHLTRLAPAIIQAYVATGEPLDKAGSYAVQGKGAFMVDWIQGSYTNVVGLPMSRLVTVLLEKGVIVPEMR